LIRPERYSIDTGELPAFDGLGSGGFPDAVVVNAAMRLRSDSAVCRDRRRRIAGAVTAIPSLFGLRDVTTTTK
jgi:hypothetical protein